MKPKSPRSTPPAKPGRIKAKLMWQAQDSWGEISDKFGASRMGRDGVVEGKPVAVLDVSQPGSLIYQLHEMLSAMGFNRNAPNGKPIAEAILINLGLLPEKRKGRKA